MRSFGADALVMKPRMLSETTAPTRAYGSHFGAGRDEGAASELMARRYLAGTLPKAADVHR